jgi:hypothetical protein
LEPKLFSELLFRDDGDPYIPGTTVSASSPTRDRVALLQDPQRDHVGVGSFAAKAESDVEMARTVTFKILVDECKARMRGNGEQPRGGIPAVAEIAAGHGMTAEALRKRITRLNKKHPRK